jgi:PST family polysaccharide transporter
MGQAGGAAERSHLRRRSALGVLSTMGGQSVKFVLRFGSTLILARLLTPAEFGVAAMVAPILVFVAALNDLGFAQAIIQRREITAEQISGLFWINLALSAALSLVLVALSPAAAALYGEPRVQALLAVTALFPVLNTLLMTPNALLSRDLRFMPLATADIVATAANVGTTIAAAWHGFSYWSLIMGQFAASVVNISIALFMTRWLPKPPTRRAEVKGLVRFGTNLTLVNIATYFSTTAANMILGSVAGKVQLGLYDRSYNLVVSPLNQLITPINRVAAPLLSRVREDPALYRRTYLNMVRLTLLLTAPAMIACATLATEFIPFALGERWRAAAPVFGWICFGGIFSPIFGTTAWVYMTLNRTDRQMRYAICTALISVASFAIGVPWGALGVAVVAATTFVCVQTPLMIYGCTREPPLRFGDFPRALWTQAAAGLAVAAALLVALPHLAGWRTIPAIVAAYLLYGALVMLLPGGRELAQTVTGLLRSVIDRRNGT